MERGRLAPVVTFYNRNNTKGYYRTKLSAVENRGYYAKFPDNQLSSSRGFQPRKVKAEFCNTLHSIPHKNKRLKNRNKTDVTNREFAVNDVGTHGLCVRKNKH